MEKSEQINELAAALAKAQGAFRAVPKTGHNPFFKTDYVTLDSIIATIKSPLSENGIAYTQLISSADDGHTLTTMLVHTSGQWISSAAHITAEQNAKNKMQALGSQLTYMKRYALAAMLGIASDEDDDGNGSSEQRREQPEQPSQEKPATMKEVWSRWDVVWNEAKSLGIEVDALPGNSTREQIYKRGKALAAAIEKAKIAAIIEAGLTENSYSAINALKHSTLTLNADRETIVNWFQQYRAARDSDASVEDAAALANAWLAGEVDDLDATSQTEDSRDSAL